MRNRKAICIITILLFAFVPVAAADWPMYGSNPAHTGVGTGNPALLPTMLWNFTTPGQPVVDSPAAAYAML